MKVLLGLLLVGLLLILVFIFRYTTNIPHIKSGQTIKISGTVQQEPRISGQRKNIKLQGITIWLPGAADIFYGDRVVVQGLYKNGAVESGEVVSHQKSSFFLHVLRQKIINLYKQTLPEPHASLLAGIVIGARGEIPDEFKQALRNTGTSHVVVASGMNVTMMAAALLAFLIPLVGRRRALWWSVGGVWAYVAIGGLEAPLIRAAIMATAAYSSQLVGRLNSAIRSVTIVFVIMLFVNPLWVNDIGFWLSFASTISLILFQSKVDRRLRFVPNILREGLSTSLAAQVGTTPILFIYFGQVSLIGPLVNALVLWIIPITMIVGSIAGLLGTMIPTIGQLGIILLYPLLAWFVSIVTLFG